MRSKHLAKDDKLGGATILKVYIYMFYPYIVHRCGASGSMRACQAAGPGSIPGRDKFPGWGIFGVFPHL